MIVTKGIEIRLYPNKGQATMFNKNIGAAIVAYNACIKTKEELYKDYGINFNPRWQYLKDFFPWMSECDSRAIMMASRNAEVAYKNWFRNLKKGIKKGHPKFKKKNKKGSYTSTNMPSVPEKLFREQGIYIPKVGVVKFRSHQDLSGIKKIRNLTVKRSSSGKYYCVICCDVEVQQLHHTGACVGIDLGLKDVIVTSDGQKIKNNHFAKKAQSRIRMLQKQLSRRKKGGKNWVKSNTRLSIAHEKLSNKRKDFIHKTTTNLVRDNDIICIEDLNVLGMLKNHKLAGAISDVSFYEIRRQLEYKCKWYGRELVIIDRWSPTSKTCNHCGYKMTDFNLGIREWECPSCHCHHDRDVNAARNILDEGLKIYENRGGHGVSLLSEDKDGAFSSVDNLIGQELCACSTNKVELSV